MRVKFTIAVCALLVLGLAVSQADAQGYRAASKPQNVVQTGNNQELGEIRLTHRAAAEGAVHLSQNNTIEITFGGLTITNAAHITANSEDYLAVEDGAAGTVAAANDEDTDVGKITITITTHNGTFTLMGVRVDVSGADMDAGDRIIATVTSTGSSDDFIEPGAAGDSIGLRVGTVMDGLDVTEVSQVTVLTCDGGVGGDRMPSIKVEEGFNAAWETGAAAGFGADADDTHIRVVVANVPAGVSFRWPGQGNFEEDGTTALDATDEAFFANPMDMKDRDDEDDTPDDLSATLMFVSAGDKIGDDEAKHYAVYRFAGVADDGVADTKEHDRLTNVFTVSPMVTVDVDEAGKGGVSDAWAQLWPGAKTGDDDDRATVLSYSHHVETKDEGFFVNVSECVTYLLFPYITCGAHTDWDTGITIANTTMDDGIFGISEGATAQRGSVTIYAYPTGDKNVDYSTGDGYTGKPAVSMISGGLAGGDSIAMNCSGDPMLAGMQGYAIVKAGFRHAHGMAFVQHILSSGAVDAVHGYIALVIPDPEFGGPNENRAAAEGETLGH